LDIFLENKRSATTARTSRSPIFFFTPPCCQHYWYEQGVQKKANPENLEPAEPVDLLSDIPPPQETQNAFIPRVL
jgi:hypothetical protein